jgi:hypothetical protein
MLQNGLPGWGIASRSLNFFVAAARRLYGRLDFFMKKFFIVLTSCFSIASVSFSQSIHMEESQHYSQLGIQADEYERINKPSLRSQQARTASCQLNKIVFGWHPYWKNGFEINYQWDLLSHLCYFSYQVDYLTGNAVTTNSWSTANVVTQALAQGKKVILCVTLFDDHEAFFGNATAKQTLITNLINLVQSRGAHGVNIDFEAMPSTQGANLTQFMIDLSTQFHASIPGSEISIALPAVDWSNTFDVVAMNAGGVDQFFIMGYDYYYGGSNQAGPTDPLYSFVSSYNYNHSRSITSYLNRGTPANKLCLGLPYYGREWETVSNTVPSNTTGGFASSRTYQYVRDNSSTYKNYQQHPGSKSGYYAYQSSGKWRQCFINTPHTLGERFEMVQMRGLAGIGIWALGYDDGYLDFWDQIAEKLTDCYAPACADTLYDMGGSAQNYYSNENYTYTISPEGATFINIDFSSFSVEANYDTLWLYDGSNTDAPLIGAYTGTNSPGNITTTTGSLTLRFKSDGATNLAGFMARYTCNGIITATPAELTEDKVTIYPNPTNGSISIQHLEPISEIKIFDATGRQVQPIFGNPLAQEYETEGSYDITLDLTNLSGGVYNLFISSKRGLTVRKIIVSKQK